MKSTIVKIRRKINNGMYADSYTVYYASGAERKYTVKGEMNNKHFDFIMNAKCTPFYKKDGSHTSDIFTIA